LAHHLPKHLKVLILDGKEKLDFFVETTGLITQATYDLFSKFSDIDTYITNRINSIGVIGPDYENYFFPRLRSHGFIPQIHLD
jgi:hypothetical protein